MPTVTDYTALISGYSWPGIEVANRPMFLTYSFLTAAPPSHAAGDAMGAAVSSFQAFDAADQAVARQALGEWADACGLTILEVAPGFGDITFSWYDFSASIFDGAGGIAFFPFGQWFGDSYPWFTDHLATNDIAGDVFINLDYQVGGLPDYGLLLHEIGHALGLKHPFEVFGTHAETLAGAVDNTGNTVMSYTGPAPTTLGPLDEDAAVFLYGSAASDGTQVQSWSWNAALQRLTQTGFNTLDDTMIGVSVNDSMLGQGGNDLMLALDGNDTLNGGNGNDTLYGGSGADAMFGGNGNDAMDGGRGADRLSGNAGDDWMDGGADNDVLAGLDGADTLIGGDGNDRLDTGTGNDVAYADAGADTLFGLDGDDLLAGGEGNDRIDGGNNNDLLFGDEDMDSLYGAAGNDQLAGGDGNDRLDGGAGNDNMFGDAGRDVLIGGAGNDFLTGGAELDRFQFLAGFGFDIIFDFEDGTDRLVFSALPGITSIANLAIANDGFGNASVGAGAQGSVLVIGLAAASLTAADMIFT
jgi:Ca2+-binding RTX toxin-like protein